MIGATPFPTWPLALAIAFNGLLAGCCAALFFAAPGWPAALAAGGGLLFFGLAAAGFALMLRLRLATR